MTPTKISLANSMENAKLIPKVGKAVSGADSRNV